MKSQRNPSDREALSGLVERVTYQSTENGFPRWLDSTLGAF